MNVRRWFKMVWIMGISGVRSHKIRRKANFTQQRLSRLLASCYVAIWIIHRGFGHLSYQSVCLFTVHRFTHWLLFHILFLLSIFLYSSNYMPHTHTHTHTHTSYILHLMSTSLYNADTVRDLCTILSYCFFHGESAAELPTAQVLYLVTVFKVWA